MSTIRIIEPGMLTTVQDLGRNGFASLGVPEGGAADPLSLQVCNRILANADAAAGLEFTLTGGLLEFDHPTTIAVGGGSAEISIESDPLRPLKMWQPHRINFGERLRIGAIKRGCRAYLCVQGGIETERILGSRSTLLSAGFGGHQGRALRAGDQLAICAHTSAAAPSEKTPSIHFDWLHQRIFRAIEMPLTNRFDPRAAARFWESEFIISNYSDRAGLRLDGPAIPTLCQGRMTSEGMIAGAIEIPENGQPIILGVDHPTTGGYPVIACVASVDLAALGQLRPRDAIRFEKITLETARALRADREQSLNRELPPQ